MSNYQELAARLAAGDKSVVPELEALEAEQIKAQIIDQRQAAAALFTAEQDAEAIRLRAVEWRAAEESRLSALKDEYTQAFDRMKGEFAKVAEVAGEVVQLGLSAFNRNLSADIAVELGRQIQKVWVDRDPRVARFLHTEFGRGTVTTAQALAEAERDATRQGELAMAKARASMAEMAGNGQS